MKAILLLAGANSRFFPLETIGHKAMNYIYGKPLISYVIEDLSKAGITEFVFVGGKYLGDIEKYFSASNLNAVYLTQDEPKGQGDAILKAKEYITEDFIVPNPYHVNQFEVFKNLIEAFNSRGVDALIPGIYEENIANYGALVLDGTKINGVVEKPKKGEEPSNFRATSAYVFKKEFLEYLEKEPEQEYSYEAAITSFAKDRNVEMFELSREHYVPSLKYPWHLFDLKNEVAKNTNGFVHPSVVVAKNVVIEDSVYIDEGVKIFEGACIKGKTYIGKNTVIGNNSIIRDSDIGENVLIGANCEIARSIVMKGSHFHNNYIGDSIIGNDCRVGSNFTVSNKRLDRETIKTFVKGEVVDTKLTSLGAIIGKNVNLGINSSTMPGVMIGENSQIWPGAIVYKNLAAKSVLKFIQNQELND